MGRHAQKPQEEEWEDPYPKKKKTHWFTSLFLLLFVYILSIGPAELLFRKGVISRKVIEVLYAPAIVLRDNFAPAELAIDWYVGLWLQ